VPVAGAILMSIARPRRARGRNGTHVLIVSHDAAVRAHLPAMLRSKGLDVTVVGDAFEALAVLAQPGSSAASTALAIVDTYLPGLSGWDLLRYLRISLPGTALLRLDVAGTDASMELAQLGVPAITKPVRPSELLRMVRRLLTISRERRRSGG